MSGRSPKQILTNRMNGFSTAWRPSADPDAYARNYDAIFRKPKVEPEPEPAWVTDLRSRGDEVIPSVVSTLCGKPKVQARLESEVATSSPELTQSITRLPHNPDFKDVAGTREEQP